MIKYSAIAIVISVLLSSCEGGCPSYDYRSDWGGKWYFRSIRTSNGSPNDTTYFAGKIKCFRDNMITIPFSSTETMTFQVSNDGKLTEPANYFGHGEFIGNDSLHYSMSYGSLGFMTARRVDACR